MKEGDGIRICSMEERDLSAHKSLFQGERHMGEPSYRGQNALWKMESV